MEFISNCTEDAISNAAKVLKEGHLVAFPTETVYGLGADATNGNAVSKVYSVKGRPTDHPLIVHISSINKLEDWATDIPDYAIKLAREFWPGPMTLILPRRKIAKDFITGGQNNIGLRVPNHKIALALLREFEEMGGQGVAAPSANRYGAVSPTTADAVNEELGNYLGIQDLILNGENCSIGIESTIIDCTGQTPSILRPGFISQAKIIEAKIPINNSSKKNSIIKVSGNASNHYSPKSKVLIDAIPLPGDGLIALSDVKTPEGVIRLSSPRSVEEFARFLYQAYRDGDRLSLKRIIVVAPSGSELVKAIRDRVEKSAASNDSK